MDIECLFVIWNNLASLNIDDPLWSGLSLLFVPKGSSQLESAEMTSSDLSIGPKKPKNKYSMMTLSDRVLSPDSEYRPQSGQFGRLESHKGIWSSRINMEHLMDPLNWHGPPNLPEFTLVIFYIDKQYHIKFSRTVRNGPGNYGQNTDSDIILSLGPARRHHLH